MRNRRVTVIGGTGFVGRYIVRHLARREAIIAVVSRHATEAGYIKPMGDVGQISLIDAGWDDEAGLAAAIAGADAVVNATGILYQRGRQRFDLVHNHGPARAAAIAKAAGVRHFVHVSALGVSADAPSAYARSKAAGEAAVRAAFPEAAILRPSIVFGPEDTFFNRFAEMARVLPALPLIGGGHTKFQPVDVGDVADAAVAVLNRTDAAGKTYELGDARIYTFKELMQLLLREIHRKRLLVPLPFALAALKAVFLQLLPNPPLTVDQVRVLRRDSIVASGAATLADLDITPTALELVLPTYIDRFRRPGALRLA